MHNTRIQLYLYKHDAPGESRTAGELLSFFFTDPLPNGPRAIPRRVLYWVYDLYTAPYRVNDRNHNFYCSPAVRMYRQYYNNINLCTFYRLF